jgi:ribulose-5-phosphate 4-epimerase/fuculose-1-phosphate aldolase
MPLTDTSSAVTETRRDLAAALRMAARYELHEGICNHFSAVVPGQPDLFLINPQGLHWSEVKASDLVLLNSAGEIVEGRHTVEPTAFFIHWRIHKAHPRAACVMHTHMPYSTTLTLLESGRLDPLSQTSLRFHNRIAYDDDYEGLALDESEGDRMASKMGSSQILFLAHHGIIVAGDSVAEAFDELDFLERAARLQVLATQMGQPLRRVRQDIAEAACQQIAKERKVQAPLHMAALRRILDREQPDYAE